MVGPDWVQLPPTSPLALSFPVEERERERERERAWYTHFFFGKCYPSRAFQRRSFAADHEERIVFFVYTADISL